MSFGTLWDDCVIPGNDAIVALHRTILWFEIKLDPLALHESMGRIYLCHAQPVIFTFIRNTLGCGNATMEIPSIVRECERLGVAALGITDHLNTLDKPECEPMLGVK